eukprot:6172579-Pleurochrysis_carterae.AAC.2
MVVLRVVSDLICLMSSSNPSATLSTAYGQELEQVSLNTQSTLLARHVACYWRVAIPRAHAACKDPH